MEQQFLAFDPIPELYEAKNLELQPWLSSIASVSDFTFQPVSENLVQLNLTSINRRALCSFNGVMGFLRSVTLFKGRITEAKFVQFGACCMETVDALTKHIKENPASSPYVFPQMPSGVFGIMHNGRIYKIVGARLVESTYSNNRTPVYNVYGTNNAGPSSVTLETAKWQHDSFVMPEVYIHALLDNSIVRVELSISFDWHKYENIA